MKLYFVDKVTDVVAKHVKNKKKLKSKTVMLLIRELFYKNNFNKCKILRNYTETFIRLLD